MAERIIRPATEQELPLLARMKAEYVQTMYSGLLADGIMNVADEKHYLPEFQICYGNVETRVDVMLLDGEVNGFVIYGADPAAEGFGLIHETCCPLTCAQEHRDALVMHTVEQLAHQGFRKIHLWLLRDNFRVRFLVEQFGFKPDGQRRTITRNGLPIELTCYIYRAPGHDGVL